MNNIISVIIRTKNEEKWIKLCIQSVLAQETDSEVEIILVDNMSSDQTVKKALQVCPSIKVLFIEEFKPGLAINMAISQSKGDYLVCLSAHCPVVNTNWLETLKKNFVDASVAGVYGRQVPTSFSKESDRRDLVITFGLDKKIQKKDSFFHNANSMITRYIWDKYPFCNTSTNIEDRLWGQQVIDDGFTIIYEPEAPVYHYHGIHQENKPDRLRGVVALLDKSLSHLDEYNFEEVFDPNKLNICCLIGFKEEDHISDVAAKLLIHTFESVALSKYITETYIFTESAHAKMLAEQYNVNTSLIRPKGLSKSGIRLDQAYKSCLEQIESMNNYPDLVVTLEANYPFRPEKIIDDCIATLISKGVETVIAGYKQYRPCWRFDGRQYQSLVDIKIPIDDREPIHIGLPGLCTATFTHNIRDFNRINEENIAIVEVADPAALVELKNNKSVIDFTNQIGFL